MRAPLLLSLLVGAAGIFHGVSASASEPCHSTKTSSKVRARFEAEARQLLGVAELDPDSFWFCDMGRVDLAQVQIPLVFDANGLAQRRGVDCARDRDKRPPAWSCEVKQNRVIQATAEVDGRELKFRADLGRDVNPDLARIWIALAFRGAPTAKQTNACGGVAFEEYLAQFFREFVHGESDQLFVNFREGVPSIMRADSEVQLQPTARDPEQFEYGCWTVYETL